MRWSRAAQKLISVKESGTTFKEEFQNHQEKKS